MVLLFETYMKSTEIKKLLILVPTSHISGSQWSFKSCCPLGWIWTLLSLMPVALGGQLSSPHSFFDVQLCYSVAGLFSLHEVVSS